MNCRSWQRVNVKYFFDSGIAIFYVLKQQKATYFEYMWLFAAIRTDSQCQILV